MNDAWGYDDNSNDQGENLDGPKALRDAYKAQQKVLQEIQQQLADERAERSKEKLSTVFESLGVPGAAAAYQGEPDPEKAKEWATSMKAIFGSAEGGTPAPVADAAPVLDQDAQAQFQQMTQLGQGAAPAGNAQTAEVSIGNAQNISELMAAFNQAKGHFNGS